MVAVKGAQSALQKPHDEDPIKVREWTVKVPVLAIRDPNGKVAAGTHDTAWNNQTQARGGMTEIRSNAIIAKIWGICDVSALVPKTQDP